eukprot:gene54993-36242_t
MGAYGAYVTVVADILAHGLPACVDYVEMTPDDNDEAPMVAAVAIALRRVPGAVLRLQLDQRGWCAGMPLLDAVVARVQLAAADAGSNDGATGEAWGSLRIEVHCVGVERFYRTDQHGAVDADGAARLALSAADAGVELVFYGVPGVVDPTGRVVVPPAPATGATHVVVDVVELAELESSSGMVKGVRELVARSEVQRVEFGDDDDGSYTDLGMHDEGLRDVVTAALANTAIRRVHFDRDVFGDPGTQLSQLAPVGGAHGVEWARLTGFDDAGTDAMSKDALLAFPQLK